MRRRAEVSWIRKITNFDFEIMAEGMGKLTCPPPQFRFAEEGEKGNYAASGRQQEITRIVRENGPITGEMIAQRLHVTRSALRGDLAVLLS